MVQWKKKGKSKYESSVNWEFFIDHKAEYIDLVKPD